MSALTSRMTWILLSTEHQLLILKWALSMFTPDQPGRLELNKYTFPTVYSPEIFIVSTYLEVWKVKKVQV